MVAKKNGLKGLYFNKLLIAGYNPWMMNLKAKKNNILKR